MDRNNGSHAHIPDDSELDGVIWDYNGTILDDLDIVLTSINRLLRARGLKGITAEQHRGRFRFPVEEYYQELGFDLEREHFGTLSDEYHGHYMALLPESGVHEGVMRLLNRFARAELPQFVLSAMHEPRLRRSLEDLGISEYFDGVYGLGDLLARSKVDRGQELVRHAGIAPERTLFIGDTDHDVEVAEALGCIPVAVATGHQESGRFDSARVSVYEDFHTLEASLAHL
jgi:phosphoglycolate phosphatase